MWDSFKSSKGDGYTNWLVLVIIINKKRGKSTKTRFSTSGIKPRKFSKTEFSFLHKTAKGLESIVKLF